MRSKVYTPFHNLLNVNYFTKIRRIIQNACYCCCCFLSSGKHVTIFCSLWRVVLNKKIIFRQIKKLHISILFRSFHPPALNACFFLLEHQWEFETNVIVAYESLRCPQCEKMDLKIIQSLLERVQIHKKCWKTKEFVGPEGFFLKNSRQFNCSGHTRDSWTTITKLTKKTHSCGSFS